MYTRKDPNSAKCGSRKSRIILPTKKSGPRKVKKMS